MDSHHQTFEYTLCMDAKIHWGFGTDAASSLQCGSRVGIVAGNG